MLADPTSNTLSVSPTVFTFGTGYWTTTYTIPVSGTYTLGFGVMDTGDFAVDSGLLIDNVRVDPIPEPTTLTIWSVIALGGLGLAYRRRRKMQRDTCHR